MPVGKYFWDIKSYKNPTFVDGELVDGEEVDSYYAAYSLPVCEIRQTGDKLLTINDSPLVQQDFDMINGTLNELNNANTAIRQYKEEIEALHHEERLQVVEESMEELDELADRIADLELLNNQLQEDVSNITGKLILDIKPVEHLFISTSGILTTMPGDRPERVICVKAKPNTTYTIKKDTATIMRAGCGSSDSLPAGTQLSSYTGHINASSSALVVTTNNIDIYIYIHLFSDQDDTALKIIEQHISSLIVTEVKNDNGINILLIGNSYTYDEFVYVPALIKELMPNLHFNLCILYHIAGNLSDHIIHMTQDTPYTYFSKYNNFSDGWETKANIPLSTVINQYPYDIVVFTEASAIVDAEVSKADLKTLIEGYSLRLNHPVNFLWHFSHAREGQNTFEQKLNIVKDILANTGIYDIFPSGTAIENANTTILDNLGDAGHMRYDAAKHLQEGIPRLTAAYANCLKICELLGNKKIGLYGSKICPTDEWIREQNIPTIRGTSVGISNTNCLLAAKCAVAAIKKPLEVTNCANM